MSIMLAIFPNSINTTGYYYNLQNIPLDDFHKVLFCNAFDAHFLCEKICTLSEGQVLTSKEFFDNFVYFHLVLFRNYQPATNTVC